MIPGIKKRVVNFHDLLMYVAIGRKHLRLMVLLMCSMLLVGIVWYVFARPVYEAKALIRLDYVPQPLDTNALYHDGKVGLVMRELTGADNTVRTAKALGLSGGAKAISLKYVFKQRAVINVEKNLELEVWPNSAELAHRWTAELVKQFVAHREQERARHREAIVKKYLPQMEEVSSNVAKTRDQRFELRGVQDITKTEIAANQLHSLPSDIVLLTKRIEEVGRIKVKLNDPTLDAVAKLSLIASLDDKASNLTVGQDVKVSTQAPSNDENDKEDPSQPNQAQPQGGKTDVVVVPSMVKSSQPWEELEKQVQQLKTQIAEASQTYLPGHRKMVALNKELAEANRRLDVEVQVASNRLGLQYQELLNRRQALDAKLPEYEEINKKMSRLTQESKMFEASQLPWQRYYTQMKKELEALDYANEKERVDLDYRGLIEVHDEPVSPSKGKIFLTAIFLGLMLSMGVPFLIEYLDHTLTNLEQVESTFQLRGLGIVPKLSEYGSTTPMLEGEKSAEGNLVENFRVIRTNLLSMGALTKAPHVIMVTSAMPKEGKTVVSSNLAISFSQTGNRTLLIDTDLRRGRLHRLFGYRKSPGLSDVLLGECTLEDAMRPTIHENLTIVSAGKHVEAGTELLGSERFRDVMKELRGKFDRIVMDTPPVLGLSETSVLQTFVDGVLFVIWSGNTPIRTMKAAIEMLQANGANFYGFVLNRLDLNATTNYYQYYYYSHDYYYSTTHAIENS